MRISQSCMVVLVLSSLLSMAAQADPLELALEPGAEEGTVEVSLTNTGGTAVSVLRWDTPFEETLSSDVFDVERPRKGWPLAERAVYVGREVKRAAPGKDQYLLLAPGATISQVVELNDYYRIDKADTRNVRFAGQIRYSESDVSTQNSQVRKMPSLSAMSTVAIESNRVQVNVSPQLSLRVVAPAYDNCSVQEQTDIVAAAQLAQDYVNTGIADLQSLTDSERAGSPRYTTWFGTYAEARFDRVLSNFESIGDALENEQIRFDCGCDESGVYAYVYPSRPYDVFLCPAFRAASVGGTDSRAGTIVHELSHFTILADTDDHVYSQRGAQSLASTDPAKAISNADSHEYFAENTPVLEIRGATETNEPLDYPVLTLGTPVSGSVAQDGSTTYQVSGASQITLSSLSGDADLYLYTDSALSAEICNSISSSDSDVCEVFAEGTVFVRVFGYVAASYTLEAIADSTPIPPVSEVVSLTPNVQVSGALDEAERNVYEISGAESIELESLSGDADLYIFSSLEFADTTLICASDAFSGDSTADSCILPSTEDTYYVLIVGYTASDYTLIAVSSPNEPDEVPGTVDMGRLVVGENATGNIASGQYHLFVVAGASSVELTSLSGDADLSVYATADYADVDLLCASAEDSSDSIVESCDIPSGADHYIAVFGFDASSYSLAAAARPDEDDPTPGVPVTETPVTETPVTETPVTETPVTEVPVTETPVTEGPVTETPVTEGPVTEVPVTEGPVTEVPVTEGPVTEGPVTPQVPDDSPTPVVTPVASSGGSGGGSLNFWGLGLLMLSVAYRRSAARKS